MIKKIKYILIISLILILGIYTQAYARITTNDPTVNAGETVTITISSQEPVASGAIDISSNSGLTFQSVSGGTSNGTKLAFAKTENATSGLATYTFKAPNTAENKTYKVVFSAQDMADADGNPVSSSSATATITVKGSNPTPDPGPTPNPNPDPTPTPDPKKDPTFKNVNLTMYSTGDINLRSSWSTSSSATNIAKGTELTVTGTSTDKVNGYVWYRVNYNGATKYVASGLLTNTKPDDKKDDEKSKNANLKSLSIENVEISPVFSPATTSYKARVSNDVTKLNINAEPEDQKATVKIQGNEELKDGENKIAISVNAEDGTVKIYEINVTKTNSDENVDTVTLGLKSLKISDTDIEKMFKTDVYDYKIDVKDISKLDIEAIANDETATIKIKGNEELKDGENIISIVVTSADKEQKVTYRITVNKNGANMPFEIDTELWIFIIIGAVLLIALIIVIVYTIKHRKQEEYDFSDNFNNNDYNDDFDEFGSAEFSNNEKVELPKDNETIKEKIRKAKDKEKETFEYTNEERKARLDYFLDTREDYNDTEIEKPRGKRGKHF